MRDIRIGSHLLQPGRQLLAGGEHVHLGARALQILSVLAEAKGEIVTKDELFDAIWPGQVVEENALQAHMSAIRKALGEDADRLKTLRGIGYQLEIGESVAGDLSETQQEDVAPTIDAGQPEDRSHSRPRWLLPAFGLLFAAILVALTLGMFGGEDGKETAGNVEVTVYPFVSAGSDPQEDALAAGVTEELITRLRRIPELRVLTGSDESPAAENAIRGSVRSDGNTLRVSARLEDADGAVQWSDNFDRELLDLLAVQEEIAAAVADTLSVSLDVGVVSSAYGGTDNPEAYVNFVQGRAARYNPDIREAITYLERAVELDPDYPRANAELIFAYGFRLFFVSDEAESQELLAKMDQASSRALEAAPDLAIGHVARAWYYLALNDFVAATRSMMRAEELDPGNDPDLKERMANFAVQFGRRERQQELFRQRALIDPATAGTNAGLGHPLYTRQFSAALEEYEAAVSEGIPLTPLEHTDAYWALMLLGETERARNLPGLASLPNGGGTYPNYQPGRHNPETFPDLPYPELSAWANQQFGPGNSFGLAQSAVFAGFAGEHQLAVDYMRLATERPNVSGYFFFWHPALHETRQTDLFTDFIEEIGIVEAFRISGDYGDFCRPVSGTEIACE